MTAPNASQAPKEMSMKLRAKADRSIEVVVDNMPPITIAAPEIQGFVDTVPTPHLRTVLASMIETARAKLGEWVTMSTAPEVKK